MIHRGENNPELKSINLSLKLLRGAAITPSPYFQRSTSTLQQLSNRLKMANDGYTYSRTEHDAAKEWYAKHGVNLNVVLEMAREAKQKQRVKETSKEKAASWEKIEYQGFDNLTIEDFLHQNQERIALAAVMSSFKANTSNSHIKNLQANYINSLNKVQNNSEGGTTRGGSHEAMANEVISNFIENCQNDLAQYGQFNVPIHKVVKEFLSVLYHQVEMVQQLGRAEPEKRNHILIITLKQLEKNSSKTSPRSSHPDKQPWRSVYEQYRKGKLPLDNTARGSDLQLLNSLAIIQDQINIFQQIQLQSSTDINPNDSNHLKRLKSIVLGKANEELFEDQLIDEAWFLIISLGLKRKDRKQEWSSFRKQVKSFIRRSDRLKVENRVIFEQWITSRISLGAFHQFVDEYKQFHESSRLNAYQQAIVMEVFVVLAFNPELIEEFSARPNLKTLSRETRSVIQQIVVEIAHFAESLRRANRDYTVFIILLASILERIEVFKNFEELPEKITKALKINIGDLFHKNCYYLQDLCQASSLAKKMLEIVLLNAKIESNQDYFTSADLCKRFCLEDKIEPIFFKCAILHQIDSRKANIPENSQMFGSQKLFTSENEETFTKVMAYLRGMVTKKNKHVLDFLNNLIQLKELVRTRKVDELSAKKKTYEAHMQDQTLLNLLVELSDNEGARLTDIYVEYYDQLRAMYKLIYLAKNNIINLRKRYTQLGNQLESLQKRYPVLKGQRLGKLLGQLYQ